MARFKKNLKALKLVGGDKILCAETIMKVDWSVLYNNSVDKKERELVIKMSSEHYEAACFVMGSHDSKFGNLKKP